MRRLATKPIEKKESMKTRT